MPKVETVLPIGDESFLRDAKRFFELSSVQISTLFKELEQKQTSFSTTVVSRILGIDGAEATRIRFTLLGMLRRIGGDPELAKKGVQELVSKDFDKEKVEFFANLASKTSSATKATSRTLLSILRTNYAGEHLKGTKFAFTYGTLQAAEKSLLLFPTVHTTVVSHTEEDVSKELHFYIDGNEFEALVYAFKEALEKLRKEAKELKASIGDKYVDLIGE
jgi:hypothetical protein